jgi:primosomal protein DnaI
VNNYSKSEYKKGMFLYGSMGSGKTYAMCAIANELAKRGISCAVVYFPELIAEIKASFNKETDGGGDTVEKLKNVPILMLDDIGSESVTSWMRDEVLGRILNHRMNHELPTFFTSNFNFEQLQSHYEQTNRNEYEPVKAARILERIKAMAVPVELVGKNYRV